jgi:hypothetical protein
MSKNAIEKLVAAMHKNHFMLVSSTLVSGVDFSYIFPSPARKVSDGFP